MLTYDAAADFVGSTNSVPALESFLRTLHSDRTSLSMGDLAHLIGITEHKIRLLRAQPGQSPGARSVEAQLRIISTQLKFGSCKPVPNPYAFKVLSQTYLNTKINLIK